jgi:hypothetical protein
MADLEAAAVELVKPWEWFPWLLAHEEVGERRGGLAIVGVFGDDGPET